MRRTYCSESPYPKPGAPQTRPLASGRLLLIALRRLVERNLRQLALKGEIAVVDVEQAAHAILEHQERDIVDRQCVAALRARLEVGDRYRPRLHRIEPVGARHLGQLAVA